MMSRPTILVLTPPVLRDKLFSAAAVGRLRDTGKVTFHDSERNLTSSDLAARIGEFDVVITGWGSPVFTADVLAAAPRLRLVAHSAGSIKAMLPGDALSRGFMVTTAAAAMGVPVAEMALLLTLMALRPVYRLDAGMKAGETWDALKPHGSGDELAVQRVGLVGAGHTGRHFARMLRGLGVDTHVYDPFLTPERAVAMNVERSGSLDELLRGCRVVSLHAPSTPQTHHMIGATQLALMPDGAILVNTARSWLIDTDALLAELRAGRLTAALDVFDQEPLPTDSPLRALPNVILTPHVASHTRATYLRQGDVTVEEVERFARGEPLRFTVTAEMLATMA